MSGSPREPSGDGGDDLFDLIGQRAAVGVAQDHGLGARLCGRLERGEGIHRVGLEAVEKMFSVIKKMLYMGFEILQRFNEEGIAFAFPSRTVYMANEDKRQLQLKILKGETTPVLPGEEAPE